MTTKEILSHLNPAQTEAVEYVAGPSLVVAGAGSGKTRVLTYKIAYLLQQQIKPWEILALTFTNKAASEMKERIATLVGYEYARYLQMGTFHSIFARILRIEADKIGFTSNFTIYDESDSRSLLRNIIKDLVLDEKIYKPALVHSRISMAKNHFILPKDYTIHEAFVEQDKRDRVLKLHKVYDNYITRCKTANAMDFDDLLLFTHQLLSTNNDIRKKYSTNFKYILVDEYQDTNHIQQLILNLLTTEHHNICVVGDDAQSIYGFRGAKIDNILSFQNTYPESKLFKLEENYRSTQNIVKAANSLIKHNRNQIEKDIFSRKEEGDKIILKPLTSDREEAAVVCRDIATTIYSDDASYNDFAILYRNNSQSRSFEDELRRQNIPYRIYGGLSFYQRKEIKDIIAYLRLIVNHNDDEALKRIINYPARGIGATTLSKLTTKALEHNTTCWDIMRNVNTHDINLSGSTKNKLTNFANIIEHFSAKRKTLDVYNLGKEVIKAIGIAEDIYSGKDEEARSKQENVEQLISAMQDFVEQKQEEDLRDNIYIEDYLQEVSLLTDTNSDDKDEEKISLMTVHASKGLEFKYVFIVGLEENIFPSQRSTDSLSQIEEERRLLYVAMTRAEKRCTITCAKSRMRYGHIEFGIPSRFIRDIDPQYIQLETMSHLIGFIHGSIATQPIKTPSISYINKSFQKMSPLTFDQDIINVDSYKGLKVGMQISSTRFGIGTVEKFIGNEDDIKAVIDFDNVGRKTLLLKYAKYTIIE